MSKLKPFIILALVAALLSGCVTSTVQTPSPEPTFTPVATLSPSPTATLTPAPTPTPTVVPTTPPNEFLGLAAFSDAMAALITRVEPAVVFVAVEFTARGFFGGTTTETKSGSGVILTSNGYIMTNNHVIEDYDSIAVFLFSGSRKYDATLVGSDPTSDLAVIKIEANNLPFLEFGDASKLQSGNWVIAVGNPEGLEGGPSVTQGIVSSLERSFQIDDANYYDIIQTDAAINPGNSGGPLVNAKDGKVIGINSFIFAGAEGLGFAVSSDTASKVYAELVANGRVVRPYLGANLLTVTPTLAEELNLQAFDGVALMEVVPNGPVARAGLRVNDVITAINGQPVTNDSRLLKALWLQYKPGDQVRITFLRGSQRLELTVTLAERP